MSMCQLLDRAVRDCSITETHLRCDAKDIKIREQQFHIRNPSCRRRILRQSPLLELREQFRSAFETKSRLSKVVLPKTKGGIRTFQLDELPNLISNTGIQSLLLSHFSPHFRPW